MTLDGVVRVLGLAAMLGGLSGFVPLPRGREDSLSARHGGAAGGAGLCLAGDRDPLRVPGYEHAQRSFWATRADATTVQGRPAYALRILSERSWQKTEPTASIEMTIVDDGDMRLAALRSTFITCEL